MNKIEEYKKNKEEFDEWLRQQINNLERATETCHYEPTTNRVARKNLRVQTIAQIYPDLKMLHQEFAHFRKTYPQFDTGYFPSTDEINDRINNNNSIEFGFRNDLGYGCVIHCEPYNRQYWKNIYFKFWGINADFIVVSPPFSIVLRSFTLLESLSEKFNQLSELKKEAKNEKIKQDRVNALQFQSAEEWVKNVMKESANPYKIEKDDIKLVLSVKITGNQHLEIPVYYKSFQKIVPQILESIQQYENTVKNSKIRVLVKNSSTDHAQWIN